MGQPRVGDDPVEVLEGLLGGGFGAQSLREFELELGDLRGEAAGGLRGGFKLGSKLGRDALSLRSLGSKLGRDALSLRSLGLPPLGGLERGVELRLELRNLRGQSGARLFDLVSARSERRDGALRLDSLGLPLLRRLQGGVESRLESIVFLVGAREERRAGLGRGVGCDVFAGSRARWVVARGGARGGLLRGCEASGDDEEQRDAQRGYAHGAVHTTRHDERGCVVATETEAVL